MADEIFESMIQSTLPAEEKTETTEMVAEETTEQVAPTETVEATPRAEMVQETEATTESTETIEEKAPVEVFNPNEWLKKETEGLFDSPETLKSSLNKFKEYDNLVTKVGALEKNQLPEDSFLRKLAEMRSNGATKDQITEFTKLNTEYEDFSELTPEQIKVAKLVLIDGYSKETAQRKVSRDFDVTDLDESSDEYKDLQEELRVSSRADAQALETYKAKISTVENKAEQERLEQVAIKSAHAENVKQTIPALLDRFTGIGETTLIGKIGKEEISAPMSFEFDDDFKKAVPQMLEHYFNDSIEPITEQKVKEASDYIKATYLYNNWEKLSGDIFKSGLALGQEKTENKFVNPAPIVEETKEVDGNANKETAEEMAFLEKVANWR